MSENGLQAPLSDEKPRGNRWHWFRLYMDVDKFAEILNLHLGVINHAHYIVHDKDKLEDSEELAKPHIHCLIYLHDYKPSKTISKWFPDECGFRSFNIREPPIAMRYLIHLGFKDKFQYDESEVYHIGDTSQFYKALADYDKKFDTAVSIIHDLLDGNSVYDCCVKYGKDFIYHIHCFEKVLSYIGYDNPEKIKNEETQTTEVEKTPPPLSLFDYKLYLELENDDCPF